jgi:hypothetical protein
MSWSRQEGFQSLLWLRWCCTWTGSLLLALLLLLLLLLSLVVAVIVCCRVAGMCGQWLQ